MSQMVWQQKTKTVTFYTYKSAGSHLGLLRLIGFRVDRVLPSQFLNRFFYQPGPVPASGQLGPGSTRRVGLNFKIIIQKASSIPHLQCNFVGEDTLIFKSNRSWALVHNQQDTWIAHHFENIGPFWKIMVKYYDFLDIYWIPYKIHFSCPITSSLLFLKLKLLRNL